MSCRLAVLRKRSSPPGGPKSKNNEIFRKWGIKQRTNEDMRADYIRRAKEAAASLGLTLPKLAEAAA